MDDEVQVTMQRGEWNQLVAIVANATGWPIVNKFFQQVQNAQVKPNGLDPDLESVMDRPKPEDRLVPRRQRPD